MNVIENSTLIEVCGGLSETPSPFPAPAADPTPEVIVDPLWPPIIRPPWRWNFR
jgi:hypothetical protein